MDMTNRRCWISTKGVVFDGNDFDCYSSHWNVAVEYVKQNKQMLSECDGNDEDVYLEQKGYGKLRDESYFGWQLIFYKKPTRLQVKVLERWCFSNGFKYGRVVVVLND